MSNHNLNRDIFETRSRVRRDTRRAAIAAKRSWLNG
jgi:hypothetical protein